MNGDYKLGMLLYQAADALLRARQRELDKHGITNIEATTLFTVDALGERATPGRIARWIFRTPHSTSALLRRMEHKGLVARANDLERRNMVRMYLTESGRTVYNQVSHRACLHSIIGALPKAEQDALRRSLEHIRDRALGELGAPKPPIPMF